MSDGPVSSTSLTARLLFESPRAQMQLPFTPHAVGPEPTTDRVLGDNKAGVL